MKNGIFKNLFYLYFCISFLTLSSCATILDFGGEEDIPLDRGYTLTEESDECVGRYCDKQYTASEEDLETPKDTVDEEALRLKRAMMTRDVILGMTRQQVLSSWGEPSVRESAGTRAGGHERWTYGSKFSLSGSRIVFFENGRVAGWER